MTAFKFYCAPVRVNYLQRRRVLLEDGIPCLRSSVPTPKRSLTGTRATL